VIPPVLPSVDLNLVPVLVSSVLEGALNYNPNTGWGATLGTLPPTMGNGNLHYELLDDAGGRFGLQSGYNGLTFIVVKNGLLLDYEQSRQHTIQLKISSGGQTLVKSVTINVDD